MKMTINNQMKKILNWILIIFLIVAALAGYGYYNHISIQKQQSELFANSKVKIKPIDACFLLAGVDGQAAAYSRYRSDIYECTNSIRMSGRFGEASYSQKAIGLKDFVSTNELTMIHKDSMHTTEKSKDEQKENQHQYGYFIEIVDLTLFLYGESVDKPLEAKLEKLLNRGESFDMVLNNAHLKGQMIKQGGGVNIFKVDITSK